MKKSLYLSFILHLYTIFAHSPHETTANLTVVVNPSCPRDEVQCDLPWLVDVSVQPPDDLEKAQYHHLWGGVGAPTLVAMQVSPDANISVDWKAFTSHEPLSVQVLPQPYNIFGVSITEVVLFDDAHDEGSIKNVNETAQIWLPSHLFQWDYELSNTSSPVHFSLFATSFNGTAFNNSGIYLNVSSSAAGFRAEERPELYCPASAAAVDLILDRLIVNVTNPHPSDYPPHVHNHEYVMPISGFNSPRYAVHLVFFSGESSNSSLVHSSDRSLDDEYAPGIFKLDSITSERARSGGQLPEGGFMQWRPVSYLSSERDVNIATLPTLSSPPSNSTSSQKASAEALSDSLFELLSSEAPQDVIPLTTISDSLKMSLAYALMGDNLTDLLSAHTLVSFGEPEDGYYTSSNYTVWSFTAGSGSPPTEGLSTNVLVVIVVGLGLPVLAVLLAGVGFTIWKCTKRTRNDHVALLNEET
ncbi:Lysosomal transcription factor NCU-G1 [Trinorchestia longiramus]|nr:Lysosomal transcription factor NCU-G1 [Trinorchestia longiramus]